MVRPIPIPLREFARAMREADPGFAARVQAYEARFGPVNEDTLSVLVQASYFCWFTWNYEQDFLGVCEAICRGRPTQLYLCGQISPHRWTALHAYIIGVQRWLGASRPAPVEMKEKIARITGWLGSPTPAKELLAQYFLYRLVQEVRDVCHIDTGVGRGVSLSMLVGPDAVREESYEDFTDWYPEPVTPREMDDLLLGAPREIRDTARAEALLAGLRKETQPPCMHRYLRYLDIRLASIGALAWRGSVPPDDEEPKYRAANFFDAAMAQVRQWEAGAAPDDTWGERLHAALGPPTDQSRDIVHHCFFAPKDDLNTAFFDWMYSRTQQVGATAARRFSCGACDT